MAATIHSRTVRVARSSLFCLVSSLVFLMSGASPSLAMSGAPVAFPPEGTELIFRQPLHPVLESRSQLLAKLFRTASCEIVLRMPTARDAELQGSIVLGEEIVTDAGKWARAVQRLDGTALVDHELIRAIQCKSGTLAPINGAMVRDILSKYFDISVAAEPR